MREPNSLGTVTNGGVANRLHSGSTQNSDKRGTGNAPSNGLSEFLETAVRAQFERERNGEGERGFNHFKPVAQSPDDKDMIGEPVSCGADFQLPSVAENDDASGQIPVWKRMFDLAVISLTWPLWLPVMVVLMIATKLSSRGPIFYRQERIGYRGRRFMIFKFRTMKVDVETQVHESHFESLMEADIPMTKLDVKGDPRLVRWGRLMRAAGLDELPQLFNVLRGEMSLVGPRPCTLHEFNKYLPWQKERVNGPPGLTGYWQVNGKNKTTFSEMIAMDIFYGKNMSLWMDISIMLRTVPAVIEQVYETRAAAWAKSFKQFWKRTPPLVGTSRRQTGV